MKGSKLSCKHCLFFGRNDPDTCTPDRVMRIKIKGKIRCSSVSWARSDKRRFYQENPGVNIKTLRRCWDFARNTDDNPWFAGPTLEVARQKLKEIKGGLG